MNAMKGKLKRVIISCLMLGSALIVRAQALTIHLHDGTVKQYRVEDVREIRMSQKDTPVTPVEIVDKVTLNLHTDSALYHPGSKVHFTLESAMPQRARVRYMHLDRVVGEEQLTQQEWDWTTPDHDYRGYLVQIYCGGERDTILGTIAVDVSSDWKHFPRYGFVAAFGDDKTPPVVEKEMDWLNRCHINGVQFQDWHYKHHWPWGGTAEGEVLATYRDIANRTIYTSSIENYIQAQHDRGMKSIFYNLCYGALEDAADDGVRPSWYAFKDAGHKEKDYHDLPDSWKSDIYVMNPQNAAWQQYMAKRNEEVYSHLDFDGFQIDQLGSRGTRYTYNGGTIDMPKGYAAFIQAMKESHPHKRLVMNAVSSYGSQQIAQTGLVDFLYNEVWDNEGKFDDLYKIVKANTGYGADTLQTVFAAYMDYELSDKNFNMAGVLLTDAVMFALGASHLELGGDHMLCREYFPYAGMKMDNSLKIRLTRYYDFLTAYENLLRDGGALSTSASLVPADVSGKYRINGWAPQLGGITSIARVKDDCTVLHLLNFCRANSLSWRDKDGSMPRPVTLSDMPLTMKIDREVHHVLVASPDAIGGSMQEVPFTLQDGKLSFTLPSLLYWTMVVIK